MLRRGHQFTSTHCVNRFKFGREKIRTEYFDKKPRRPTKKHQPSFQEIRTPIKNDCIKGGLDDREQLPYPYAENKKAHH
jgi:hypothetical protein